MTEKEKAVAELQQWLRNINKSSNDAPTIIPDGKYSTETRLYVEKLQREKGLSPTGVVDYATWEAIRLENEIALQQESLPLQVAPIKNENLPLKRGDDNLFVDALKLMLGLVAERFANFDFTAERGFGEKTEEAVRHWQNIAFIDETGQADKPTWNSLAAFYLMK